MPGSVLIDSNVLDHAIETAGQDSKKSSTALELSDDSCDTEPLSE